MSNKAFFEQIEQNINALLADRRYKEAYDLCLENLKKYPDSSQLHKAKARIEEEVEEMNNQKMEQDFKQAKDDLDQEKYVESIKQIKKLLEKYPGNKKLEKLAITAQKKYQKHVKKLQDQFDKEQRKKLDQLLEEDEYALQSHLFTLEKNNVGNRQVLTLTAQYRDKLIEKKIKSQKQLLKSDKYNDIKNFIASLEKIDNKNPRIAKLHELIKLSQHSTQKSAKDEFVYKGLQHLKTLMQLKKWDKALQVAEEILTVDKGNKAAAKIYKKAQAKEFSRNRDIVADKIKENTPLLQKEYQAAKGNFIKI